MRILFHLDSSEWHGSTTERLWAEGVGNGRYRLRNSPFYAFGVSLGDVVFANLKDGELEYCGTSIAGGHSTYRIIKICDRLFASYWSPLQEIGCTYEEGPVFTVDIPPSTDIYQAYNLLQHGENDKVWDFEEGHCGHNV
ncbi:DUF4265 domain-containing protein [Pseudenhygromyxa sp. WMMC2535]|nr:DUF4265 domain-containing protein [Pseudenhygromyxa sp. WMMC2535]